MPELPEVETTLRGLASHLQKKRCKILLFVVHNYVGRYHFGGDYDKLTFPELSHAILRNLKITQ